MNGPAPHDDGLGGDVLVLALMLLAVGVLALVAVVGALIILARWLF